MQPKAPGTILQEGAGTVVTLGSQLTTSELTSGRHLMEYRSLRQILLQNFIQQMSISDSQILSFII